MIASCQHNVSIIKSAQYLSCYGPTSLIFIQLFCCKSQPLTASRTPYIHLSIWITHQFGCVFRENREIESILLRPKLSLLDWFSSDRPLTYLKLSNQRLDEFSKNRSKSGPGKLPILVDHS